MIMDGEVISGLLFRDQVYALRSFFASHGDCSLVWIPCRQNRFAHSLIQWAASICAFGFINLECLPEHLLEVAHVLSSGN